MNNIERTEKTNELTSNVLRLARNTLLVNGGVDVTDVFLALHFAVLK